MADWSNIVRCEECGKGTPIDTAVCLHCGNELRTIPELDPDHERLYEPPDKSVPFVAQRTAGEVERAQELVKRENLFSWCPPKPFNDLTDQMIADAENALRVKLPASLLAILKTQNGGYPVKRHYSSERLGITELCGIAPGCITDFSLQEMPARIWSVFEGYLADEEYRKWRGTLEGKVHPDWGEEPKIPETILLLCDELHWGIGLNYIECGRQGEPSVVHVEMEGSSPEQILEKLAPDFLTFLRKLYDGGSGQP